MANGSIAADNSAMVSPSRGAAGRDSSNSAAVAIAMSLAG